MPASLSPEDLSVIALLWLVLSNLGFEISDFDLTEPGYIKRTGAHTIYSFAILLREDQEFPKEEFGRLLDEHSKLGNVKPHFYGVDVYPARGYFIYNATGESSSQIPLKNFTTVYISLYI